MIAETVIGAVSLDDLEFDTSLQARAAMDDAAVAEYAELYEGASGTLPPPVVFYCEERDRYYIGDGWHRIAAARRLRLKEIDMEIRDGGRAAAVEYAVGANRAHGVRRTPEDKRRAVEIALKEWPDYSDRKIAELCGVSHPFVSKLRKQVETFPPEKLGEEKQVITLSPEKSAEENQEESSPPEPAPKRVGRDGKSYTAPAAPQPPASKQDEEPEALPQQPAVRGNGNGEQRQEQVPEARADAEARSLIKKLRGEVQRWEERYERAERSADIAEREREKSLAEKIEAVRDRRRMEDRVAFLCQLAGIRGGTIEDLEAWVLKVRNEKQGG